MVRSVLLLSVLASLCTGLSAQDEKPRLVIDSRGHSGIVGQISFTPDGSQLITGCEDKVIRVWDVATGEITQTYRHRQGDNFEGAMSPFGMSPDGRYLTFSTSTGQPGESAFDLRMIDRQQNKIVALFRGHQAAVMCSHFSSDGSQLFTGDASGSVRIWNMSSFTGMSGDKPQVITDSVFLVGHTAGVGMISTNPDASMLLSVDTAGQGFVWQRQPNGFYNGLGDLGQGSGNLGMALYSPDGQYIVGGGRNGQVYLWRGDGSPIRTIDTAMGGILFYFAFSPDSSRLALSWSRESCSVDVYDLPGGNLLGSYKGQPSGTSRMCWHPDGESIACAGGDNNDVEIWKLVNGQAQVIRSIEGDGAGIWSAAIDADSEESVRVAFGNRNDYTDTTHDEELDDPLHRIFDFIEMSFLDTEDSAAFSDFRRANWSNSGVNVSYGTVTHLNLSNAGQVQVIPNAGDSIRSFSFLPNGNLIVGSQYLLGIYSQSGQQVGIFPEQIGPTFAVAPSKDGKYLATASGDAIHLWNPESGRKLASAFVSRSGEWVCWAPSGHYAASPGGERYVGWHVNKPANQLSEFFPSSVFREQFHKPEIVRAVVKTRSLEEGVSSGGREETPEPADITKLLPPDVVWISPAQTRGSSDDSQVHVKTTVKSDGSPLREVKLLLNGKAVETFYNIDGETYEVDHTLDLLPGENRLSIFAKNENSGATSEERVVHYRTLPDPAPSPASPAPVVSAVVEDLPAEMMPNLYMLSVGVSEYKNSELTLGFCDDDARAVADVFAGQKGKLFNKTEIRTLIDADASRDGILEGLEWLQASATQKDIIILFLAAHGMNEGRNYYLVPWDAELDSLRRSGVAWGDFADILGNLPSKTLMFLDTCHSGQLGDNLYKFNTRGASKNVADASEAIRELTSDENGVVVMAASTQGEESVEHEDWGHGAFTLALIEGLTGKADFIEDGLIQLRELDTYVAERVKELSGGIQHPTTVKPSSISRFPLIRVE